MKCLASVLLQGEACASSLMTPGRHDRTPPAQPFRPERPRSWGFSSKPLVSLAAVVSLIASTTTESGLRVRSEIDQRRYAKGVVVSDEEMAKVNLEPHSFHGDWNYTIRPRN